MSAYLVLFIRILMVAGLYLFLGWALYTLWYDLRFHNELIAKRHVPTLTITMSEQDQDITRVFNSTEVLVGRATTCDLTVSHETVSSRHARLSYHHNQWWVEDLHSTNGTFLNDERVSLATVIISGDELRCGRIGMVVDVENP